jgi:hypothetical protein
MLFFLFSEEYYLTNVCIADGFQDYYLFTCLLTYWMAAVRGIKLKPSATELHPFPWDHFYNSLAEI